MRRGEAVALNEQVTQEIQMSIRYDILRALVNNQVMMTAEELMAVCNVTDRKRMVNNIQQGITDKLITRHYDDVTHQTGYTVTALGSARLASAGIQYNGKSQAQNVAKATRYGLTIGEVREISDSLAFLDHLIGLPAAKNKINRAHRILERVLGKDAGIVYAQEDAA